MDAQTQIDQVALELLRCQIMQILQQLSDVVDRAEAGTAAFTMSNDFQQEVRQMDQARSDVFSAIDKSKIDEADKRQIFDYYTKEFRAYQPRITAVLNRGQDYLKQTGQFKPMSNYLPFDTFDD